MHRRSLLALLAIAAIVVALIVPGGAGVLGTSIEDHRAVADAELARFAAVIATIVIVSGYSLALTLASHRRRTGLPRND